MTDFTTAGTPGTGIPGAAGSPDDDHGDLGPAGFSVEEGQVFLELKRKLGPTGEYTQNAKRRILEREQRNAVIMSLIERDR